VKYCLLTSLILISISQAVCKRHNELAMAYKYSGYFASSTSTCTDSFNAVGSPVSACEKDRQDEQSLHGDSDEPVNFLLGSFVSFDIIAAASSRSCPILEVVHRLVLEKLGIDLKHLTACENWVMILIFEISLLDNWKKEAQNAYELSIVGLAKRGGQIREHLRRSLADLDNTPPTGFSPSNISKTYSERNHLETTKIFALSAMTYLNVVLSGANPTLPEIVEACRTQ
jgi:hypothetical protein